MRILALDSSTRLGSLALVEDDRLVAECSWSAQTGHAAQILPMLNTLLEKVNWHVSEIELMAFASGPGSFAGLRVGISTLKGIAFGTGAIMVGVNTLEAMAWPFSFAKSTICPILDAKKDQIYGALFESDGRGKLVRLSEDTAQDPEVFLSKIPNGTLILGDGIATYHKLILDILHDRVVLVPEQLCYHRAGSVAALGLNAYQHGGEGTSSPNYVRPPDAALPKDKGKEH